VPWYLAVKTASVYYSWFPQVRSSAVTSLCGSGSGSLRRLWSEAQQELCHPGLPGTGTTTPQVTHLHSCGQEAFVPPPTCAWVSWRHGRAWAIKDSERTRPLSSWSWLRIRVFHSCPLVRSRAPSPAHPPGEETRHCLLQEEGSKNWGHVVKLLHMRVVWA
jgi:hypothetical protein